MRKEWIICAIVIITIVILNIITQNYTEESVKEMDEKLETLKQSLLQEEVNQKETQEQIETIMNDWKKRYEKLAYFIEHDELEKVETELTSLRTNIEIEQYEEGIPDLDKSVFILNHIKDKFKFEIKNIF